MESLLAEELASEKMRYTLELKDKRVKETALDAEAEKVRREGASAAAEALRPDAGSFVLPALDNTRPAEEVLAELETRASSVEQVLAVGHQPQVGEIAALLTRNIYDIRPGGIVAVATGPSPRLLWALNPDELR